MCRKNQTMSSVQRYFVIFIVIVIVLNICLWKFNPKSNTWNFLSEPSHDSDETTKNSSISEQPESRHEGRLTSTTWIPLNVHDIGYQREMRYINREALVGDPSENVTPVHERRPEIKSTYKTKENVKIRHQDRYLIYLCDKSQSCSGFADRQRAIVGLYLLAIATNRKFGVIMTNPTNITDFYVPNEVNWNIKIEDLAGKSTAYLEYTFHKKNCSLNNINSDYPEDVLYIRSIYDITYTLGRQRQYRKNLPKWATGSTVVMFGHAWKTLMTPTSVLRQGVNSLLLDIAKGMQHEVHIIPIIQHSQSCRNACSEIMYTGKNQSSSIDKCLVGLSNFTKVNGSSGIDFLTHLCPVTKAIKPPSLESIQEATGYDYVELELVCVQVRLGSNSSIKGEAPEFNKFQDVVKIWDHIRPYINRGHHLYLASDSQQVRDQAKRVYGPHAHVSSDPIVHIAKVKRKQSGWEAMRSSLVEQLLLATSCKILVYSGTSGYGTKAAMVRHVLNKGRTDFESYSFAKGKVTRIDFDLNNHYMKLPSPIS